MIPLAFNQQVCLTSSQISALHIDYYGNSDLPCYKDSIFAVNEIPGVSVYENGKWTKTEDKYLVTQFAKSILDFPAGGQKIIAPQEMIALRVNPISKRSDRPELKAYTFEFSEIFDGSYLVTRKNLK